MSKPSAAHAGEDGSSIILWTNYGQEGWSKEEFSTVGEAIAMLQRGCTNEWILTRKIELGEIKSPQNNNKEIRANNPPFRYPNVL